MPLLLLYHVPSLVFASLRLRRLLYKTTVDLEYNHTIIAWATKDYTSCCIHSLTHTHTHTHTHRRAHTHTHTHTHRHTHTHTHARTHTHTHTHTQVRTYIRTCTTACAMHGIIAVGGRGSMMRAPPQC